MAAVNLNVKLRFEAIALGLPIYVPALPCKRGHLSPRYTRGNACIACAKLKQDEWVMAHPESVKSIKTNWAINNPEKRKTAVSQWCSRNPEKSRAKTRRYRANKHGNGGSHTAADVVEIFRSQRGKCAYCRQPVTMKNKHVDHIRPLFRGGTNDRRNLQILCARCNLRKNAKDPIDYARTQGMLL